MPFNPTSASVETEGCDLHYWHQGTGPLLIFVPGGNGIGRQYNAIFEHLDQHLKVCTYDRRQSSASTVVEPKPLNPAQQARDIIAIIKDLGYERASIFANSGGGVIAFQFAVSYPEYLDHVVVHEAPTTILLHDATFHLNRAFMLLDTYRKEGELKAIKEFQTEMKGYQNSPPLSRPSPEDGRNFWENEFLTFTIYCPDLRQIRDNKVSIAVAAGEKSKDAFYARTTIPQAEILQCPRFMFPGHHNGYESEPVEFAPKLLAALKELGLQIE
ncbi:Fc.00g079320.m01.CDS01 [Cosmosporella sp. VM-42]